MLVSEILAALNGTSEWMVLFNLQAIRHLTNDATIAAMYHLPETIDWELYSHVVLCSQGRFLAHAQEPKLVEPLSNQTWSKESIKYSLAERFQERLALFDVDESDCLGLGEMSPFSPVILHLKIESGTGQAQAIFDRAPSRNDYELLKAAGVTFLSGETKDNYYLARFQNRLPVHIHAGILSHFSRTAHCNIFFLRHGDIDEPLREGLLKAAAARINWGKKRVFQALAKLAQSACESTLAMTCKPPFPDKPFSYGDLVPLGFVLQGLNQGKTIDCEINNLVEKVSQQLSHYLLSHRQKDLNLWAFHSQRLVTSTDSVLILQGLERPESVAALEMFADGQGGYYPQLWSKAKQHNKMIWDESCAHWCQSDYATTCLVRSLRQEAGLEYKTPIEYLAKGINTRSGLYFANPYLVDWVLARAIAQDESAIELREQLLTEILASKNDDYSFGVYDRALSTALAILAMAELEYRGTVMRVAQLRLLDFINHDGLLPFSTPFYSSSRLPSEIPEENILPLLLRQTFSNVPKQLQKVAGEYHNISLYEDNGSLITTSVVAQALAVSYVFQPEIVSTVEVHPRYQCSNHCEYIAKFALAPYLNKNKAELIV